MLGHLGDRGFRPFFLLGSLYAAAVSALWVAMLLGLATAPAWLGATRWHAHEMLFGFAAAAVAGFLLTAVPNWTARPALTGGPLFALVALWLAGRVACAAPDLWPTAWLAVVDGSFLFALAAAVARPIAAARNARNYGVVALVLGLAVANACVHADALGLLPGAAPRALRVALFVLVALIAVIGGRITPAFTVNALRRAGRDVTPVGPDLAARVAVPAVIAFVAFDLVAPGAPASGVLAALAALALALRMRRWQTRRVLDDPLVWSLHLGSAWLPIGFALLALATATPQVPPLAGVHALGAGAIGTMILAVASRVALGHTGRALAAPPAAVTAYALVTAGAVMRVVAAFAPGRAGLLAVGGLLWASAFAVFACSYAPIFLGRARAARAGA